MIDTSQINLLNLVGRDVQLKKVAGSNGGEHAGPCPLCGGTDRFRVWSNPIEGNPRVWCRQCGLSGDAITYLMKVRNMTFLHATEYLSLKREEFKRPLPAKPKVEPPVRVNDVDMDKACFNPAWQAAAARFVTECDNRLQDGEDGEDGRRYLAGRKLPLSCASIFEMGYNPSPRREMWGETEVWIPRGIIIPWVIDGVYWNIRIRRFPEDMCPGDDKYISVKGNANGLYNASLIRPSSIVVMVEGEFNCQTIQWYARQARLYSILAVATGSYTGARALRWVMRVGVAGRIFTAFDPDEAGRAATEWWRLALPEKVKPLQITQDPNDMVQAGVDIAAWLREAVA